MPLFTINTAGTSPASKIYIYEILNENSLQRSNQPGLVIEFVHDRFIASSVDITFVYHDLARVPANFLIYLLTIQRIRVYLSNVEKPVEFSLKEGRERLGQ